MLCKKIYIGQTGRRVVDTCEKNDTDTSKPVACHSYLTNLSHHNPTIFVGYPYTMGTQRATKISNKNSSFNLLYSILKGSMNASHPTYLFTNSFHHISTNGKAPLTPI